MASEALQNPSTNAAENTNEAQEQEPTLQEPQSDLQRGTKRPAEAAAEDSVEDAIEGAPMSKNQLKKLKRQKLWEAQKDDRKAKKKEKRASRQERRKVERDAEFAAAKAEGRAPRQVVAPDPRNLPRHEPVPVSVILDCQYEQYMTERELISLTSQVTRCYSDNRAARYPVHLAVSSYGGAMKHRFENILHNQNRGWKGINIDEGDFVHASHHASDIMNGPEGGKIIPSLEKDSAHPNAISLAPPPAPPAPHKKFHHKRAAPAPEPEADDVDRSIVYLTADSPYTLDRLEPNTSYVIGGIIDKNREKGLCYRIARQRNVRTAKLPIGEFMVLQSRHILATNHVLDIMLKYLELGDWGAAFMKVIPQRKGGKLKDEGGDDDMEGAEDDEPAQAAEEVSETQENEEVEVDAGVTKTDTVTDDKQALVPPPQAVPHQTGQSSQPIADGLGVNEGQGFKAVDGTEEVGMVQTGGETRGLIGGSSRTNSGSGTETADPATTSA